MCLRVFQPWDRRKDAQGAEGGESMSELTYWLWLSTRRGLGPGRMLTVLDYFVTPERAYYAGREEYALLPLLPAAWQGMEDKSQHPATSKQMEKRSHEAPAQPL